MMSSATASVDRNTRTPFGTRLPRSAKMPSANAMSVAVGTPQPCTASGCDALNSRSMQMGAHTPPAAPSMGGLACRMLVSSPADDLVA